MVLYWIQSYQPPRPEKLPCRSLTLKITLAIALGVIPFLAAHAETPEKCDLYAEQAVGQLIKSQRLGCGFDFNSGQWWDNIEGHYAFCLTAPPERIVQETKMRADALVQCKMQKEKGDQCKQYATTATRQYKKALAAECGFGSEMGRWSDDFDGHYTWCMNVDPQSRANETNARANSLIRCISE